ncbi:hypothetical protein A9Q87_04810 [Flavobacteriales bacterium 34_180_T64]|nr:hypothetical protein A9Q87_04810 [Flavobacteriales bacterium 34_180_T64]
MIKNLFFFLFCLSNGILLAQTIVSTADSLVVNDGPYIFIEDDNLVEKRIVEGEVLSKDIAFNTYDTKFKPEASTYEDVDKIVALSDIHGQFDLAIEILKNNKVIDAHNNWSFGNGHFVIVGDIFDRGPKVTETLWFVYNLEKQAEKSGGKVHFLLGNHEYMILHKDLRYLHEKYVKTSELLHTSYDELYGEATVLGRWLRSKATLIKINDNIFVHGGVSPDFIMDGFKLKKINRFMRKSIDRDKAEMKAGPFYTKYYGDTGPIWYRGYFYDNLNETVIDSLLTEVRAKHFVVGHCSQEKVLQLYNNKIFAVDSSIKNGEYGEVLFIDVNSYARGTMEGEIIKF